MKPKLWMGVPLSLLGIIAGSVMGWKNVVFISALVLVGSVVGLRLKQDGMI